MGNNVGFGSGVRRGGVLFGYGDTTATDVPEGRCTAGAPVRTTTFVRLTVGRTAA